MKLLLAEDDARIARDLTETLSAAGYVVDHESDGEEIWFKGDVEDYAAVILDFGLPNMDGLSILKRWRANGRAFPVLVLTARGDWTERVEGIDAGADDYLAKPFETEELLARLRAIIRRSAGRSSPTLTAGPVTLDPRQMRVTVNGAPRNLSPQEYRLLSYLMLHAGRVISQMELTEHLYAQDFERDSNAIEVLVGRVRRKLGADLIRTRRGFGYIVEKAEPTSSGESQ
jgi:two-component system OmpR family response regulator